MTKRSVPTPEELRQLLRYDPDTGKLYWKERGERFCPSSADMRRWNSRHSGKEALTSLNANGYFAGHVMNRSLLAHRVIWALHYGEWPENEIDHINCNRADNRLCNLRQASLTENARNRPKRSGTSSLPKGVATVNRSSKFQARIRHDGRLLYLGCYDSIDQAHAAYCEAAKRYHGEFARTE